MQKENRKENSLTFKGIQSKPRGVNLDGLVLHDLEGPVLEELRRDEVRLADGLEEGVLAHVLHEDLVREAGLKGANGGLPVRTVGQAPVDHALEQSALGHLAKKGED
jgi:hypothetical protein